MTARRPSDYVQDIISAAEKAVTFLGTASLDAFAADDKTAFAVMRALEIVGEATKRVPDAVRTTTPQIPWRAMAGIRDKLVHDYVTVDHEVIYKTVVEDLPPLLLELRKLLDGLRRGETAT
jgi:uncharacterized protein with HEPN domain